MYHLNLNLAKEEQEKVSSKNSTNSKTNGKQKQKKKNNITPSQSPEEKRYYDSAIKYLLEAHKWNVLLQGEDSPDSLICKRRDFNDQPVNFKLFHLFVDNSEFFKFSSIID